MAAARAVRWILWNIRHDTALEMSLSGTNAAASKWLRQEQREPAACDALRWAGGNATRPMKELGDPVLQVFIDRVIAEGMDLKTDGFTGLGFFRVPVRKAVDEIRPSWPFSIILPDPRPQAESDPEQATRVPFEPIPLPERPMN
jgi:hypothetical protein